MRLLRFISLVLLIVLPYAAHAYSPLTYSKTVIKIVPADEGKPIVQPSQAGKTDGDKKAEDSKTSDLLPSLHRVEKEFTVEVRPLAFLEQKDFIAHQPFTDKEGMMMVIDPASPEQLKSSNLMGKIDVLFVLEDGTIEKIAPDIDLSTLAEPVPSEKPVRAFVFLKAGMAQQSDIKPGDHVVGYLFKTHPIILQ